MKKIFTFLVAVLIAANNFAADITINAGKITNLNWTSDNVYLINGWAFVDSLDVLTIEAGTVIKGAPGEGDQSSALIISRGGKINAVGTAEAPIIFTSQADQLNGNIPDKAYGLWGGLIILGNGITNNSGEKSIEGISSELEFGLFGSEAGVEDDDAGILKFASIRHGGTDLGDGDEINGLSLGACGSGTTISYVEVTANQDDGIELFGGAPRIDHFLVSYCGDDGFDLDHGTRALGQFLVVVQDTSSWGECFGEHDGGSGSGETSEYFAHTIFSNATYIGNTSASLGAKKAFVLRDNWSGEYHNSVFVDAPAGINLEWTSKENRNSYDRLMHDSILFKNNVFSKIADNTVDGICQIVDNKDPNQIIDTAVTMKANFVAKFNSWNNDLVATAIVTIDNPVPDSIDVAEPDFADLDDWFEVVDYKGAFDPGATGGHWAGGWTLTYKDVTYTGIANNNIQDVYSNAYPMPASDLVKIDFENNKSEIFSINVYNMSGQLVKRLDNIKTSHIELNVSSLTPGLYTYNLTNNLETKVSNGKLIIK